MQVTSLTLLGLFLSIVSLNTYISVVLSPLKKFFWALSVLFCSLLQQTIFTVFAVVDDMALTTLFYVRLLMCIIEIVTTLFLSVICLFPFVCNR